MKQEIGKKIELSKISDINKIYDIQIVYSKQDKEEIMKNNNVGLIKLTNKKHPSNPSKLPKWFIGYANKIDSLSNKLDCLVANLDKFIQRQEQFNHEMIEFKTNQEQFNQMIVNRLDNLVKKNNLKE